PSHTTGSTTMTGWLHIKANTITIESGGKIVADFAGYQGAAAAFGPCSGMTAMLCAASGTMQGYPGGGGGYFGPGADGTLEVSMGTCTDNTPGSKGGSAFFNMAT